MLSIDEGAKKQYSPGCYVVLTLIATLVKPSRTNVTKHRVWQVVLLICILSLKKTMKYL